jgi:hypothetical protein
MIDSIAQANFLDQVVREVHNLVVTFTDKRWHQDVFQDGALREQVMLLEDEANPPIAEIRKLRL